MDGCCRHGAAWSPTSDGRSGCRGEIAEEASAAEALRSAAAAPVVLPDGRRIVVAANVGSAADARKAVECGADAVGLLRTELLVLDKPVYPDEEQQRADLAEIFEILGDRPVVVRVLDAGGDKPVATLDVDEKHNGFLGVRGLRYLLANPDLLRTQLRAIMRAGRGASDLGDGADGHRCRRRSSHSRMRSPRRSTRWPPTALEFAAPEEIGVMVEVPAAALAADEICAVADFVSVGSNDLTSYTMAADRTEPGVADLLDPSATAVQRLLDQLCDQARAAGTPGGGVRRDGRDAGSGEGPGGPRGLGTVDGAGQDPGDQGASAGRLRIRVRRAGRRVARPAGRTAASARTAARPRPPRAAPRPWSPWTAPLGGGRTRVGASP